MDEKDWLLLKTLYEQQNMTKTAEVLYVSQPSLSYRIQQLEKEFGITIMHRGRRGVEFTPQGEYLVKYAIEMLQQLQRTKEFLLSMDNKISGTLKIGTASSLARYKLPHILKQFHTQYPDVEFKVTSSRSSELTNSVYKQDVHIGFIRGDYNWPEEKHLIMTENIWIVSKREISLPELPGLPRIMYKTDISLENLFDNWWKETFSKPPSITMEVDHMETCKEMVLSGFGYAIIPQIVLTGSEDFYRIQLRTKHGEPILRKSWMIYRKESMQISLLKAFVDFIKERKLM
ncbi:MULTISPECIES: LysR family transcriptional regulator [Brevibacillus]|uniref:LysR family transcriptional regulator n=1 Tax=Brevibacillus TaxID=55080 RepID=UPI001C8D1AF4|nr:LysR family transcriptional regulator [Brevibacillus brevis]MBY0088948.1 LysR family transcriptional regulator [Brevibacillus brevis]MCE0453180.1 LysR family transcriptional regulator [Brevibacillus sp. AF8]UKK96940.1 LysR family transcriptional regulator [Brevibacillus brevis]